MSPQAVAARRSPLGRTPGWLVGLTCLALLLIACGGDDTEAAGGAEAGKTPSAPSPTPTFGPDTFREGTVPDVLATDGRFSMILGLLDQQDVQLLEFMTLSRFQGAFAPTDEAFASLPAETLDALFHSKNIIAVRPMLANHVLSDGLLRSTDFESGPLEMGQPDDPVTPDMTVEGNTLTIGGATVIEADIEAGNGIIHSLDRVLGLELVELE